MERSNASGGSEVGERLATAAATSSAGPPPPLAEGAADIRTRRGRRIAFGLLGLCALLVIALGALAFTHRQPPVKAHSSPQAAPRPEDGASPPLGFTDSLADIGWQDYRPSGFSIGLPPLWMPYIKDMPHLGPYLKFVALGFANKHGNPWLYVFKVPVGTAEVAETYFEQQRLRVLAAPSTVRVSELTEIQLSDGVGYTSTSVSESPSGRISETSYGILHDGYEYTLVISVPLKHMHEYDFQFDDIARTFEITD